MMRGQNANNATDFQSSAAAPDLGRLIARIVPPALLWLVVLMLLPYSAFGQSVLTDDAYVAFASRNTNHGANPSLKVSSSENVYLKFTLSTLPANTPGAEVDKATIKLYVSKMETAGKLDVYAVGGEWDERTITANNAPPLDILVTTTEQIGIDHEGKFLIIDITSLVQQWLGDDGQGTNGLPNNGLALVAHPADPTTPEVGEITVDSKENSQTSHEAQLNIQLERGADGLQKVEHDTSLTGDGVSSLPLGVANGGINTVHLADNAVRSEKIGDSAVTSSKLADGSVTSAKITAPLSLSSADAGFTLLVANTGAGPAISAQGAINTTTQYNIGGQHILSSPGASLYAGIGAGQANTTGSANAFFGFGAGETNSTGTANSFFGFQAGQLNTTGWENSFFGALAGGSNTEGTRNAFFGFLAGVNNTTGADNSLFGHVAGRQNTTGSGNSFFGSGAGAGRPGSGPASNNSFFGAGAGGINEGSRNSFFGREAGRDNTTGSDNSFFGHKAGLGNVGGSTGSANSFFGASAGEFNTTGRDNSFFGVNAGRSNTTGSFNAFFGPGAGTLNTTESFNTFVGPFANGFVGITNATAIGANAFVSQSDSLVLGRDDVSVGIGISAPRTKLHVLGKVYVEANGQGVILKSPSGLCFELTVTNLGALTTTPVACP